MRTWNQLVAFCLTCSTHTSKLLMAGLLVACTGSLDPPPAQRTDGNTAGSGQGSGGAGQETTGAGGFAGVGTAGAAVGTAGGGTAGGGAGAPPTGTAGSSGAISSEGGSLADASRPDASRDSSAVVPLPDVAIPDGALTGPGVVTIVNNGGGTFTLLRDGMPYYVRGFVGQTRLEVAQAYGGNATRIYTSANALRTLDQVAARGITLLLGIELSKVAADYSNETYKTMKRTEVTNLLATVKAHPALLWWSLGNEINLGADVAEAWTFVNELAGMIRQGDPNHPVMVVLAGSDRALISRVATAVPQINVLGINSYGFVTNVDADVKASTYTGPWVITEFGPTGHWEVANTSWTRPFEQTSAEKATIYQSRYDYIYANRARAFGSYVFLWAQKQERTPTWYGMFLERLTDIGLNQESCPTVDAMAFKWTGVWPVNRAPNVTAITLNGLAPTANVTVPVGQAMQAQVTAVDPESDAMTFIWELLPEPTMLGTAGSSEARPTRVSFATTTTPMTTITAPATAGQYRLLVYVRDGQGHAGTANIPFLVN